MFKGVYTPGRLMYLKRLGPRKVNVFKGAYTPGRLMCLKRPCPRYVKGVIQVGM